MRYGKLYRSGNEITVQITGTTFLRLSPSGFDSLAVNTNKDLDPLGSSLLAMQSKKGSKNDRDVNIM